MISFRLKFNDGGGIRFNTEAFTRYYLLTELIRGDINYIPYYKRLLLEISKIEQGEKEFFEERSDVGRSLMFDLKITKETTYCETLTNVRQCLELPTSEFKELVESWIKFVEVNTAAFSVK